MRRKTLAAFALMSAMALAGCNNTTTQPDTGTQPVAEDKTQESASEKATETESETEKEEADRDEKHWNDGVKSPTDYLSDDDMAKAAMWTKTTSDARLAAVMKKAAKGEKIIIACIGGSITQGTISNGDMDGEVTDKKCYADIYHEWWTQTFPDTEIEFINAGIGATDSYLGVHRVKEDVLKYEPDLVLIEFSVNDANTNFYKTSYDNLVRAVYQADSEPAVMLLFMGQTNGSNAQENDLLVGFTYETPMLSYVNVIDSFMKDGKYTDKNLSGDVTHPSALGHAITGEMIWKYLNNVNYYKDTYEEPAKFDYKGLTKDKYLNASILDNKTITPSSYGDFAESQRFHAFPNDWTCEEGEGNLTFTVTCKNLGIMYFRTTNGKSGQFDILVDGEVVDTLDANFKGGWGNYAQCDEVYSSDEAAEHTVVIRKAADSTGDTFTVLGLLVSE